MTNNVDVHVENLANTFTLRRSNIEIEENILVINKSLGIEEHILDTNSGKQLS
jgi:hypothetical protein